MNTMSSGISVFFIQKLTGISWWKSNSMPSYGPSCLRNISPRARSVSLVASSTSNLMSRPLETTTSDERLNWISASCARAATAASITGAINAKRRPTCRDTTRDAMAP